MEASAQAPEATLAVAVAEAKNVTNAAKSDTLLATVLKLEAHTEEEEAVMARAKAAMVVATEVDVEVRHVTHVEVSRRLPASYCDVTNVPRIRSHE